MSKQKSRVRFPDLQRALDRESYEWMLSTSPDTITAIERELTRKPKPSEHELRDWIIGHYGRDEIARRVEQVARYLLAQSAA